MKTSRLLLTLTAANMVLLAVLLVATIRPAHAKGTASVLRGRALEIVDDHGRVRASISVLPASASQSETVLLRLITERGRPSVKIGASEKTSGLSFAGPTGTRQTYVILQSSGTESMLEIRNENGGKQTVKP